MMKHIVLLLLSISWVFGFDYRLKPLKITESIYCFFGATEEISQTNGGNMVNSCFVKTSQGFVVIDSGPTHQYAAQAFEQMQKIAKLPVKFVINTHDHDDHWLGNSFYKERGALLIGSRTYEQNVTPTMHTRMLRAVGKEIYKGTKIVKLDKVVKDDYNFTLGGLTFEIKQLVPQAHTKGDLILYVPEKKTLFAGDELFYDRITSLRDGSVIGSLKALDKIDAMGADFVIAGHGYATDANATKDFREYLTTLKEQVLDALDHDVPLSEIVQKVPMDKYKDYKLYDVLHSRNVYDAYIELEMYDEDEE